MKKIAILLLMVILILPTGCSVKNNSIKTNKTAVNSQKSSVSNSTGINYNIAKASYTDNGIKIDYPQITKLRDNHKQQKINELIKNEALEIINGYKESGNKFSLDITYKIKWKSSKILSIEYLGYANVTGGAHPSNIEFTTNIDINKGSSPKLNDIVNIDVSLSQKYKHGKYQPWSTDLNLESAGVLNQVKDSLTSDDLIEQFQQKRAKFYFTKDSLGMSADIAHVVGDHVEFEIPYQGRGSKITLEPSSRRSFINKFLFS